MKPDFSEWYKKDDVKEVPSTDTETSTSTATETTDVGGTEDNE